MSAIIQKLTTWPGLIPRVEWLVIDDDGPRWLARGLAATVFDSPEYADQIARRLQAVERERAAMSGNLERVSVFPVIRKEWRERRRRAWRVRSKDCWRIQPLLPV